MTTQEIKNTNIKSMTLEQINEVKSAVFEMYTLKDVYWKVVNMDWTLEMFEFFMKETISRSKKDAIRDYRK